MTRSSGADAEFDIVVIGGGPAGAVSALHLARCGHRVCLIERDRFPRQHVGESLPPSVLPLLESLGIRKRIEDAGFLRCRSARIKWAGAPARKPNAETNEPGLQVDRGRFDEILLQAAVEHGTQVIQPGAVSTPVRRALLNWHLSVHSQGRDLELQTRFMIDASGRARCLRAGQRVCHGVETLALFAWWRGTRISGSETRVEAGQDCWYWGAPLPDGTFNATVFVDRNRIHGLRRPAVERLYRQLIDDSELLRECPVTGTADRVFVCDATCRSSQPVVGGDWCKVGEAAFSFDPLSSQGVQAAMASATRGAAVVNTLLQNPAALDSAVEFYTGRQREIIDHHMLLCRQLYGRQSAVSPTDFWIRRSSGRTATELPPPAINEPLPTLTQDDTVALADHVRFCRTPILRGMLIEAVDGIRHARSTEPLVFLGDVEIVPLLREFRLPSPMRYVLQQCALRLPVEKRSAVLHWLWNMNIIEPVVETKSIFSVVREDDSVFAHKTPSYDGKDELN